MKINIKKIILWILFWYYLIPYYLLKKFIFRGKHGKGWSITGAIVIVFVVFCALIGNNSGDSSDTASQSTQTKTHYVIKKIGTKELAKQKQQKVILLKEKKKKQAEYKKLKKQLDNYQEKETAEKKKAEAAAAESAKAKEKSKSASASSSRKSSGTSSNESDSNDNSDSDGDTSASSSRGNMNTADTGKIVGNSRSKIYHVPGQAGYRMNSSNAVYFNSEQEAIAAGYRKAKR